MTGIAPEKGKSYPTDATLFQLVTFLGEDDNREAPITAACQEKKGCSSAITTVLVIKGKMLENPLNCPYTEIAPRQTDWRPRGVRLPLHSNNSTTLKVGVNRPEDICWKKRDNFVVASCLARGHKKRNSRDLFSNVKCFR